MLLLFFGRQAPVVPQAATLTLPAAFGYPRTLVAAFGFPSVLAAVFPL